MNGQLTHMTQARRLYAKCDFRTLEGPLGDTEHCRFNSWAIEDLSRLSVTWVTLGTPSRFRWQESVRN
jgi:hypothetical protein